IGFFINLAGDEAFRASTIIISITQILSTFFLSLLYFLAIVNYSLNLSLSVIGFMCLVAVFLRSVFKLMHKYGEKQIEESRSATSTFLDSLNNIKAIRALLAGNYATTLYKQKIFNYSRTLFLVDQAALLTRTTPIIILLLLLGSYQAIFKPSLNNEDISFIVTIIVYMMRLFPTVGQCLNLLMRLITDSKIGKDITEIIGIPEDKSIATSQLRDPIKKIEFKKIHFSYSKKPER
ncbi:ABC transporter transmembrane domain-containing protein, partial [Methylophilus sp. UBA6697]|uniref:ABC transporter transmembrane domain-containing protein n=1 Tax=Methylophilus sp. UBA6697 TaxID=1946902 RepID=UPI0025DA4822